MRSVWKSDTKEYGILEDDIEREIVVVGGGIAGFLTVFKLSEAGLDVTLIEADRLFSGTTGKTTAKITANQGNIYGWLYKKYGFGVTSLYYNSQLSGMRGFAELVKRFSIDCDFEETESFIFSRNGGKKLRYTCNTLKKLGADCQITDSAEPVKCSCALKMDKQYIFDPLKFLSALPVNFEIFEHTRAVNIDADSKVIQTDRGTIKAKIIIIATHYPIINSHGGYFLKLRQSVSYTVSLDKKYVSAAYLDEEDDGLSIRPWAGGTLLGGFDHRSGRNKYCGRFSRLKKSAQELFGDARVTHEWCAEDVMTFDGMPMAGRYSKNLDGIYVITGFNKWGMTNSMVCSEVIRDLIVGRDNPYADIFSPQRRMKGTFGKFIKNAGVNVAGIGLGYFKMTFKTVDDVPKGHGMIVRHNGKLRAVYRDVEDNLYIIGRMCPHMHCQLEWNGDGKTWDCPCHGSRFDIYGNVISEPTTKSCKYEGEENDN